jgi:hypothetical protein
MKRALSSVRLHTLCVRTLPGDTVHTFNVTGTTLWKTCAAVRYTCADLMLNATSVADLVA